MRPRAGIRDKIRPARPLPHSPAKKLTQHRPSSRVSAKKFARHAINRQFRAIFRAQGELFRAHTHHQAEQGELFRARHGKFSKSKHSRPRRHIHAVHMKPPARLLTSGSSLLKQTAPKRACPSAPPTSKDVQGRIVSDLEAKLRRLDEAESATSEALGRLTDLRYLCMENSLYPRECTIA